MENKIKRTSTRERLLEIMSERNLRQADILRMSEPYQKRYDIQMGRSALSQYVNGKSKPDDKKLFLLAKTLNVSESWLMGYDDDQERMPDQDRVVTQTIEPQITSIYNRLEKSRQKKVLEFAKGQLEEQNNPKGTVTSIFDKLRAEEECSERTTDYVEGLVSAGQGVFQDDNLHMEVSLRVDDIPEKGKYDTIAKVAGDSMEPMIKDNDLLFIKVTSQVDVNKIGIFQVNNQNFVKKLKRDYDGSWYLQSLNNNYSEIYLTENDSIRTIGEVVDIYRED